MSLPIEILPVRVEEVEALQEIAVRTFSETFETTNSPENMKLYLESSFERTKLDRELRNPGSSFFFARFGNEIAGYLKFNTGLAQTEFRDEEGFEVERIYVLKKYYGKGVGAALMEFAFNKARKSAKEYIWLGVYEKNFRALAFYSKYGFREFGEHIFQLGDSRQRDVLMKVESVP